MGIRNYGIFPFMGNAGFIPSTVVSRLYPSAPMEVTYYAFSDPPIANSAP